jgi:hypothetical protein
MIKSILNIAGGKISPIEYPEWKTDLYSDTNFMVNLDQMYLNAVPVETILNQHIILPKLGNNPVLQTYYCNMDIYDFLKRYCLTFDGIAMYRFLEHVPKVDILFFIYLLSTTVKVGGFVDVIVPDYQKLAKRIIEEDVSDENFEAEDIITTFELLNEPSNSPHASIWTFDRAIHFFELEGRFKVRQLNRNYYFDGRDIYLRFLAERIK